MCWIGSLFSNWKAGWSNDVSYFWQGRADCTLEFLSDVRVISACVTGSRNCTLCTIHYTTSMPFQNVSTARQDGQKYLHVPFLIPLNFLSGMTAHTVCISSPSTYRKVRVVYVSQSRQSTRHFSSRPNWDPPPPPSPVPVGECAPRPLWFGGGTHSLRDWVGPNSDEGTDTVVRINPLLHIFFIFSCSLKKKRTVCSKTPSPFPSLIEHCAPRMPQNVCKTADIWVTPKYKCSLF